MFHDIPTDFSIVPCLDEFLLLISRGNNRKTQACVLRPCFNTSKPGERERQNPEVGKQKPKGLAYPIFATRSKTEPIKL